ncbi:MAG: hypothetical protein NTV56_01755 [Alphaproteobacteria bacterium]|nr:hypothetical protein [Alphaproteobacteria bacterium]
MDQPNQVQHQVQIRLALEVASRFDPPDCRHDIALDGRKRTFESVDWLTGDIYPIEVALGADVARRRDE